MSNFIKRFNPLKTGIIGSLLAALGVGWLTGYLDYVLFIFLGLTVYGFYRQSKTKMD